ncbi:MAG: hypothetical protein RQ743_13530 [Bacteroidales bacterium]|nr:hypothetical protein [Bacteroidales bacterium]
MNCFKKDFFRPIFIGVSLLAVTLSGCIVSLPSSWATHREAFSSVPGESDPVTSTGAFRSANLDFTYDEVYSSCIRALSFAQLNILDEERDNGKIYAVRSASVKNSTQRYYYMVYIEELTGTECRVRLYSKVQGTGSYRKWGPNIIAPSLLFLGTAIVLTATMDAGAFAFLAMSLPYPAITVPMNIIQQKNAVYRSTLKWSPGDEEYLDRIMSFIRTDLLQR